MIAKTRAAAVVGIDAHAVEVEVDIANGLPAFNIVGLPDAACRESGDRVRAAIKNSDLPFPTKRVTVNLAPADLKKEGSSFDLAIAVGILVAGEAISAEAAAGRLFCAELSLDGRLRGVPGVLPRAAWLAGEPVKAELLVAGANAREASCVEGLEVRAFRTLAEVVLYLRTGERPAASSFTLRRRRPPAVDPLIDFSDIKGQSQAKRGLELAAAGGHNVLMIGPPGAGKTMLARRLPTILSAISSEEAIETTKIHSVAGLVHSQASLVEARPFRDPHHTISDAAMVGGGRFPKPGEVSLAHNGVLFLDELAEFPRNVLEVLRQPLEEGRVTIARAASTLSLPARFMLVAAMNPCPCGYFTDPKKECHCSPIQIKRYLSKISGPLLDRIDIQLEIPPLKADEITGRGAGEESRSVRERVERARGIQRERYRAERWSSNAELEARSVEHYCATSPEGERLLKVAIQEMGFSARAYHKVLKVARTIADLEGAASIESAHLGEALHYRTLDRRMPWECLPKNHINIDNKSNQHYAEPS